MKKIAIIFLSVILLSWSFASVEVKGLTLKEEKQNIINDLQNIKSKSDNKKTHQNIDTVIKQIEKSFDEKFWKDDTMLNFKSGNKVINADKTSIDKLDEILKEKKELDIIKAEIVQINIRIVQIDKILLENGINSLQDIIMSEKGNKKIVRATDMFEKGNDFLEKKDYRNAIENYEKSWEQIKKALKDPHFKKMKIVELEGSGDLDFDEDHIPDVYLKIIKSAKNNKPKQVQIKITGECVNGEIHDDASMKIGFSTPVNLSTVFFDDEFKATNQWFKENDPDKKIDPVMITTVVEYFSFPSSGDDLIQINPGNEHGSFEFSDSPIAELGDQTGWIGEFSFKGEPGDYYLHFWMPLTEPTNQGDSCNFVSSFSIPTTIEP